MTAQPFFFNHNTGEVVKDGRATTLGVLQTKIFAALSQATINHAPIGTGAIAKQINEHEDNVEDELPGLIRRLKKLGILVAYERGRGRWLEFEDVPKWQPTIAPPVRLEGEGMP